MKKEDFRRKHKVSTKLEEEKLRKQLMAEEEEKIDVLGQSSDKKAAKWVIEEGKKVEKKEKEKEAKAMDILWTVKGQNKTYRKNLLYYLHNLILGIGWPKTYSWGVWFDGKGIVLAIKDKNGKLHKRAFKPTHNPKYDLNLAYKYAVWAEDILDLLEGNLEQPKSKGGVWLPTTN